MRKKQGMLNTNEANELLARPKNYMARIKEKYNYIDIV